MSAASMLSNAVQVQLARELVKLRVPYATDQAAAREYPFSSSAQFEAGVPKVSDRNFISNLKVKTSTFGSSVIVSNDIGDSDDIMTNDQNAVVASGGQAVSTFCTVNHSAIELPDTNSLKHGLYVAWDVGIVQDTETLVGGRLPTRQYIVSITYGCAAVAPMLLLLDLLGTWPERLPAAHSGLVRDAILVQDQALDFDSEFSLYQRVTALNLVILES